MANKKMTKRDYYNALLNIAEVKANGEMVKFIEHELELLAKKNSSKKKPTANQVANEGLKEAILNGMESGKLYTITDMINYVLRKSILCGLPLGKPHFCNMHE